MMRSPNKQTKHGAQWASQQFRSLVTSTYDIEVKLGPKDWPLHYQSLGRLATRLGGYEEVVDMSTWWFATVAPRIRNRLVDPAGLWGYVDDYRAWVTVNRSLIGRMGVRATCDYLRSM